MGSVQLPESERLKATSKSAPHTDVLLVEDDIISVASILRCLEKAGFSVRWTDLGGESEFSDSSDVIILDLHEASAAKKLSVARSVLSNSPEKSILITRAHGEVPREAEASEPQLTWVEKPLDPTRLPAQIGCEVKKVAVRRAIQSAPNFPPQEVVRVLSIYDGSLLNDASQEILQEIRAESEQHDMTRDPIDTLYAELADLTDRVGKEPDVEPLMQQKIERLRRLQAKEAAAMTTWFEAQRNLRPGSGYEAIKRAEKLIAHEG